MRVKPQLKDDIHQVVLLLHAMVDHVIVKSSIGGFVI